MHLFAYLPAAEQMVWNFLLFKASLRVMAEIEMQLRYEECKLNCLTVGSWQLAAGKWQLVVGSWQLAVERRYSIPWHGKTVRVCVCVHSCKARQMDR